MKVVKLDKNNWCLVADLFNQYRMFYGQTSDISAAQNYIVGRLENNESVIFAATDEVETEDQVVGFVQLYPLYSSISMSKNWILNDLFVNPTSRGKGAGTMLINTAMEMAINSNAKFLQLETAINNYDAQRLYESMGFFQQAPEANFYLYKISFEGI